MREIDTIIIHCSATENGKDIRALNIDSWHKERGWRGIGYHYVITVDGKLEIGRPIKEIGAHVKGHNIGSVGICIVGMDKFYEDQWYRLRGIVMNLERSYEIKRIYGHNHFNHHKTCPGFEVWDWLTGEKQPLSGHILT